MQLRHRQQGLTFWSGSFILIMVLMVLLIGLKLTPAYIEHGKVKAGLENMAQQPGIGNQSKAEIRDRLQKYLDIDNVSGVDLRTDLTVSGPSNGEVTVRVAYEVRVPLAYNISALLEFDDSVSLRAN